MVFYCNFFGRGYNSAICHFNSISSPSVLGTVQLYISNSFTSYSLKLILLRQRIRKMQFGGGITYHYDYIKHSPPQEYNRNAVLSVGRDTGDKRSKKLSQNHRTVWVTGNNHAALPFGSGRHGGLR